MQNPLLALLDLWLRRYWSPDPGTLAAATRGQPATVVTGASEGIGLALARRFAAKGDRVVLVARRAELLEAAAAAIRKEFKVEAVALCLDVTVPDAADRIAADLSERQFYVDVLVNNAAIGLGGPFGQHHEADIARLLDLNVKALSLLTRRFLPAMCVRGRGGILNVASLGGYAAGPYQAAYYASKAYVIWLTRAVGYETRGQGVRVAVLAPGPVGTRFHARMGADNALYRWLVPAASPEAIARSAVRGFRWGHRVILPGPFTPLFALVLRIAPTIVSIPFIAWLLLPRGKGNA